MAMRGSRFGSKSDKTNPARARDDGEAVEPEAAESADRYERSSERLGASSKTRGFARKNERAGVKSFTPARSAFQAAREAGEEAERVASSEEPVAAKRHASSAVSAPVSNADFAGTTTDRRAKRLDHARALMQQAAEQPKAARTVHAAKSAQEQSKPPDTSTQPAAAFDDADPFEPFEQCAPSANESSPSEAEDSVYTRTSQRKRKPSASEIRKNAGRPKLSLKGRALGYLSRREHSRAELSRKLRPYVEETDSLETVLEELERDGWLSNTRFVESIVHRRAAQMGGSRIIHELKRHAIGDALIGETAGQLAQTETARAQAVWAKKFGTPPATPAERAKQARFLASRGFSSGTIGKILKGADEDFPDEFIDE